MPSKQLPTIWPADQHTVAKIAILKAYLVAWFQIMGRTQRGRDILFIDGFAGPGSYTNYADGSPAAALVAAKEALSNSATAWKAGSIHCAFIEEDSDRFSHLQQRVTQLQSGPQVEVHLFGCTFLQGIARIRAQLPRFFSQDYPLFAFLDPFGPTGIPFETVAKLLGSPRSEILIYLDVDGISRIFRSGASSGAEAILDRIMPDSTWRAELSRDLPFAQLCRTVLDVYRRGLMALPNVRYTFAFEMRSSANLTDYYLVFASQHTLGLRKMKEAMRKMDQTGQYQFIDAHVGRSRLFRFDNPEDFAPLLFRRFAGSSATYDELDEYALNETPFLNPKSMLRILENAGFITVASSDSKRRKGTFNEERIRQILFANGDQ